MIANMKMAITDAGGLSHGLLEWLAQQPFDIGILQIPMLCLGPCYSVSGAVTSSVDCLGECVGAFLESEVLQGVQGLTRRLGIQIGWGSFSGKTQALP
jgi:hypothetical protein